MIYLLYGLEDYLIKEKIKEIIQQNNFDNYSIDYYDLEQDSIKNIIDSASTFSLFSDKRLIIVENSFIFTGSTKKIDDIELLENYFDNFNSSNIIIFTVNNEKLDSRKKIVTKIKKIGQVIEYNKPENLNNFVSNIIKPYKISPSNINLLIERVGTNTNLLIKEIEKIKTYKNEDLEITSDDIINLTHKNINVDIFNLLDNILNNNKEKALESYEEMLKIGEEPIKIITMLGNQFRLIYQVKELYKKGYREFDIMDILGQKQYPIKKASERMNKYTSKELLEYINELAELDINIKSGLIDKKIGLELFILKKEH